MKIPELLSPAGTPEAFCAALDGGADAVYFGVSGFNARANARNFSFDEMRRAVYLGHTVGVKSYITLNTLLYGREYNGLIKVAEEIYRGGADAVIVADLGAAALLAKYIPELELHASTQCSGHNLDAARALSKLGFSRFVPARELSFENIRQITKNSPIETEIFVHGALCVSHSGQCLFSSIVGGRSGNRGECAQPCRMKYSISGERGESETGYPLSLKDLTLCRHVREIINSDIDSLKIEGRMKSPYYVREVTSIFHTLLNEKRDATDDEVRHLDEIFSRGGFTDGYFISSGAKSVSLTIPKEKMAGVRGDLQNNEKKNQLLRQRSGINPRSQKQAQGDTLQITEESFEFKTMRKREISVSAKLAIGEKAKITLTAQSFGETVYVSAEGVPVEQAQKAPLDENSIKRIVSKLGNTPFFVRSPEILLSGNVFVATLELNKLRRDATSLLENKLNEKYAERQNFNRTLPNLSKKSLPPSVRSPEKLIKSARFSSTCQISADTLSYFDIRFLPFFEFSTLEKARNAAKVANGLTFPPVIFDSERNDAERIIENARAVGIKYALVPNIGEFSLAKGFRIIGDFRLNVASAESFRAIADIGKCESIILSAEATIPQIRDTVAEIESQVIGTNAALIAYGRLPLMLLERCILRKRGLATAECSFCADKRFNLIDRIDAKFPIVREWQHRNVVLNSCPNWMADRSRQIATSGVGQIHFLFSVESPSEITYVVEAYKKCLPPPSKSRRV